MALSNLLSEGPYKVTLSGVVLKPGHSVLHGGSYNQLVAMSCKVLYANKALCTDVLSLEVLSRNIETFYFLLIVKVGFH